MTHTPLFVRHHHAARLARPLWALVALLAATLMPLLAGCGTVRSLGMLSKDGLIAVKGLEGIYKVTQVGHFGKKSDPRKFTYLDVGDQMKLTQKDAKGSMPKLLVTHVSGKAHANLKASVMLYRFKHDIFAEAYISNLHEHASQINAPLFYLMRVRFDNEDKSAIRLQAIRYSWVHRHRSSFPGIHFITLNNPAAVYGTGVIDGSSASIKKMLLAVESDPENALRDQDIMHLKRVSE